MAEIHLKQPVVAMPKDLILASTSPFRKALLAQLQLPFRTASPEVDETPKANETTEQIVLRLAIAKAQVIADKNPSSIVIGSDQLACCDGMILGKPHTHDKAIQQLTTMAGKRVTFYTGLCVILGDQVHSLVEPFHVHMRPLSQGEIEHYLNKEKPYNCAGSFKSEGLGISLFERLEGKDPNALIGLPLISLIDILNQLDAGPLQA